MYKSNKKNLEKAILKLYIYTTRLNLMLLVVLTSTSVVVAARQKQRSKILDWRVKKEIKRWSASAGSWKMENQDLKIKRARASAQTHNKQNFGFV